MEKVGAVVRTSGVGSMPGADPAEATRIVTGELDVPHVVELPARGPGADLVGRTLALVSATTGDLAGETTPTGWRLVGGRTGGDRGRQMRRGSAWLAEDVDRLEEQLIGFAGVLKVQVAGPWTLAAAVEAPHGTRILADPGACRAMSEGLAEALVEHVGGFARAVPGARVVVQLDEPSLPIVVAGRVRTPSGRGALRVPDSEELVSGLARLVAAAREAGAVEVAVHCCARDVPFGLLGRAGFSAVSLDATILPAAAEQELGSWWDRGGLVMLGVAPSVDPGAVPGTATTEAIARAVAGLWRRIGFGVGDVGPRTWLTPTCGLAGASPAWSRRVGGHLREAARMLESAD